MSESPLPAIPPEYTETAGGADVPTAAQAAQQAQATVGIGAPQAIDPEQVTAQTVAHDLQGIYQVADTLAREHQALANNFRTLMDAFNVQQQQLQQAQQPTAPAADPPAQAFAPVPTPAAAIPAVAVPTAPAPTIKLGKPEKFEGRRDDVDRFVYAIKVQFTLQPTLDDHHKVLYMISFLAGVRPQLWATNVRETEHELMHNFALLEEAFRLQYGDPNRAATAQSKLETLRQTSSVAEYATRFQENILHLHVTDETKTYHFWRGLHHSIKTAIANSGEKPSVYSELEKRALVIDQVQQERRREIERETRYRPPPAASSSTPAPRPRPNDVVPMEVDVIRHSRLTPEQREHRRRNGLCLFCGQKGHLIRACPVRPPPLGTVPQSFVKQSDGKWRNRAPLSGPQYVFSAHVQHDILSSTHFIVNVSLLFPNHSPVQTFALVDFTFSIRLKVFLILLYFPFPPIGISIF